MEIASWLDSSELLRFTEKWKMKNRKCVMEYMFCNMNIYGSNGNDYKTGKFGIVD